MANMTVIFEEQRPHLRTVAYRLLGSVHEADDAVQETWLRLERADVSGVVSLPAWLATVVSRICLDQLRSRASRREELGAEPDAAADPVPVPDPAAEAEHADAVGQALMVLLDTLAPAERLAFCLHDLFGLSFDEIAPTLGRSSGALALLHPEAMMSADAAAAAMGSPALISGAEAVAQMFSGRADAARPAELDGFAAATWSKRGEVKVVFAFSRPGPWSRSGP
jgi:RNA polymerase sigma factor (sigma-70 family)